MPEVPPNLQPLPFDAAAADAAIGACQRAASVVAAAAADRLAAARVAQASWKGRYRDEFDQDLAVLTDEAADLEAALRGLAGDVARAGAEVRRINQRRAVDRAEWQRAELARTSRDGGG